MTKTTLRASASLVSDNVCLFGPEEEGATTILAQKKSTDRDFTIDVIGFAINSHSIRISLPREKTDAKKKVAA